ncbi:hypothetical protein H5410_055559 [Solanum commersonii]|uniref:Uncharacterized protein n=1 Tax=Solanum commersonii TaxID=4109 RepID=A0A9J5WHW9_SOLCO|nr:hypothetical protein H5410_055559 [Solanum commersonii]
MDVMSCHDFSIDYLSNNLCWFVGDGYPLGSLPSNLNQKTCSSLIHTEFLPLVMKRARLSCEPYGDESKILCGAATPVVIYMRFLMNLLSGVIAVMLITDR